MRMLVAIAVVATVSLTVTKSVAFQGLREWAKAHSPILGKLLSCPWCFSQWVSFLVAFTMGNSWVDALFLAFALPALAAPLQFLAYWSISQMGDDD